MTRTWLEGRGYLKGNDGTSIIASPANRCKQGLALPSPAKTLTEFCPGYLNMLNDISTAAPTPSTSKDVEMGEVGTYNEFKPPSSSIGGKTDNMNIEQFSQNLLDEDDMLLSQIDIRAMSHGKKSEAAETDENSGVILIEEDSPIKFGKSSKKYVNKRRITDDTILSGNKKKNSIE